MCELSPRTRTLLVLAVVGAAIGATLVVLHARHAPFTAFVIFATFLVLGIAVTALSRQLVARQRQTEALARAQEAVLASEQAARAEAEVALEARESAMETLRAAMNQIQDLYDNAPCGYHSVDAEGHFVRINATELTWLGYAREEILGRDMRDVLTPDSATVQQQTLVQLKATGTVNDVELELVRKDGSVLPVLVSATAVTDERGVFLFSRSTVVDLRVRKAFESALRMSEEQYRSIVSTSNEGIWLLDGEERVSFANPRMAEMLGERPERMIGRSVFDFVFPEDREMAARGLEKRRKGGEGHMEFRMRRHDGQELWVLISATLVHDGSDRVTGLLGMFTDITRRKRMELVLASLAEAGRVLASSLDYQTTLESVARLPVPAMADACTVWLIDEPGAMLTSAAASTDDAHVPVQIPLSESANPGLHRVVRDMTTEQCEGMRSAAGRSCPIARSMRGRSASCLCLPLAARGYVFGALTLARSAEARPFEAEDVALSEKLATHAALAIDNARLYKVQQEIAHTLQQSLLPPSLPEIPGLALAACYHPVGPGIEVGGDFYDLFPSREGAWVVMVGDVAGKGPAAAAVTALARHTVRSISSWVSDPLTVLGGLNQILLQRGDPERFLTLAFVLLEPTADGARLRCASAGHPPPLVLRAAGAVEAIAVEGAVLGVTPDIEATEVEVTLRAGDQVVLYTDGVTEARHGRELYGEERLCDLLAACRGKDAGAVVRRIEAAVMDYAQGRATDDIAVLVIGVPAPRVHGAQPHVTNEIPTRPREG